jgi:hypothetical protein
MKKALTCLFLRAGQAQSAVTAAVAAITPVSATAIATPISTVTAAVTTTTVTTSIATAIATATVRKRGSFSRQELLATDTTNVQHERPINRRFFY